MEQLCLMNQHKILIKPIYSKILDYGKVRRIIFNNKWGLLNQDCQVITKPIYDYIEQPINKYVEAKLYDKIIYIDTQTGKKIDF